MECFIELLTRGNMNEDYVASIARKTIARGDPLAIATAVGYMSQIVYLLRERYPSYLSDSKRMAKIRDKPGCTINDLCVLLQEIAIKGAAPPVERERGRPNVAKYINDIIIVVTERQTKVSVPLPPELTAGLVGHSLRRGSAACVNVSPQLSIQWISTRGSNVDSMVLEAVLAALFIHLEEVSAAVTHEQATSDFTSHYLYRFHEAMDNTDAALGLRLSLENCVGWGRQLRSAWETANYVQLGERCGGDTSVLAATVTQLIFSIATMQRALHNAVVVEMHSLAGCGYNWYTLKQWNTASQKKQQFGRADLKACVNIMMVAGS
ncbi:hypothetical protein PHMEG_0007906 [Phytophthora megakarya]|uniref:Uncharacterized protein n=1 Tax=Phytophthora megakarya TaxID=4795 RepID=A0A225WK32_9STRA|nr:hypothetical protein PHMEG_0007906 [Phytophthora megakarya]